MSLFHLLSVSSSGMGAQRVRAEALVENLANVETTRKANGELYHRKDVTFAAEHQGSPFSRYMADASAPSGVSAAEYEELNRPTERRYAPGHPDADKEGYITLPNINVAEEMVDLLSAARGHQANAAAMSTVKDMIQKSLELFR